MAWQSAIFPEFVAQGGEKLSQLGMTAVDVADDVKRAGVGSAVVPEGLPVEGGRLDFIGPKRKTRWKPSRRRLLSERRSWEDWLRITWEPN